MTQTVSEHCAEIERCNQRGGRMLSVVDLIEAGTITADLAACALAAIGRGASFMVGAVPGGAGKTTVMGALLNFVPADVELAPADGLRTIRRGLEAASPRRCYICHEIGRGSYYAYLWGRELREYFELPPAGHMLATNLHADNMDQARGQICDDCAVPEPALRRMGLAFFMSFRRRGLSGRRRIEQVWASDGRRPHRLIYDADSWASPVDAASLAPADALGRARQTIDALLASGARTIHDVRTAILASAG